MLIEAKVNIDNVENFKAACKRHCDIIETCLLDFEKYGIKDLLNNIANSINQIKITAKSANIDNAVELAQSLQTAISQAIEGKIDLFPKDIDIILRANDLFYGINQFSPEEICDLFEFEEIIISEYLNEIKTIFAPFRIKKGKNTSTNDFLQNTNDSQNKTILLEKFKFELVKSTYTIEKTFEQSEGYSAPLDIIPVSNALNTIKGAAISAGISKAFDLADSMHEFISSSAVNNMPISSYQMDLLLKCNNLFKEIAAGSAIALIDKFEDFSDYIDNYSNFLNNFLSDQDSIVRTASSKLINNDILFNNLDIENRESEHNSGKLVYFGYKSNKINEGAKYNRLLEYGIDIIANISPLRNSINSIKDLKLIIRNIQLNNNDILFNITNTEKITQTVFDISSQLDEIVSRIDDATAKLYHSSDNIKNKIDAIYGNLFSLRSISFGDLVLGFNDLANDLANYSKKNVKLKMIGRFVRIGSEVAPILEIVLPQILRFLIISNIEQAKERLELGKREFGEIIISARLVAGKLIIDIDDDGSGSDSIIQAKELENIITLVRNNKGNIEIKSQQSLGTKIILSFDLDYILLKCLLFDIAGDQYAIQKLDSEGIINLGDLDGEQKAKLRIIEMRKVLKMENDFFSSINPAVILNDSLGEFALAFDKFLGEAELVPSPPNKLFGDNPLISSTSIINEMPVIILDKDGLLEQILGKT